MPKTRKFIDKKKAITFQLVHRSQQDPLIADDTAPQHVLVPVPEKGNHREKRIEEQHKYGIYFNDDSDYLQHLKDSKDNKVEWPEHVDNSLKERRIKLQLPASVFPSEHEEKEGMLSKAAPISGPQLHLDPDVVAAMDEDFDFSDPENQLEDNFIELAEGVASDQEFNEEFEKESDFGEEMDEVASLPDSQFSFNEEETKTRFTNYSMTSSVIRRNEQLTLLDERFEQMYADYDENEIGALDCEEIEGHVPETSDILFQYAEDFKQSQKKEQLDKEVITSKIAEVLERDSEEEDEMVYMEVPEKEKWDCESILSTYSNIYNHPKLIKEPSCEKIQISKKTGVPLNILGANKLTKKALDKLNEENEFYDSKGTKSTGVHSVISQLSTLSLRPKGETPEERKERKKLLKDYKRERRLEKKANALAFKEEAKRQVKINLNNRNNVQGNKIL